MTSTVPNPQQLADTIFSLRFEAMPLWVEENLVAYLDDRSGVMHLFVGDPETGERQQLTTGSERMQSLCGVPGVSTVVVGTDVGGNERQQLKLVDLVTKAQNVLGDNLDRIHEPFVMSADGHWVVYRTNDGASGEFSLYRLNLYAGIAESLWDDAGQVRAHAINAHGDLLSSLLTSNLDADLYLVPAAEERSAVLQVDDESWISDATFAPDGASALVLTNADSDHVRLISIDLKTHANEVLLDESGHDIEIFAVSPDGRRLVWSVNADGYSVVRCAELHRLADAVTVDLPAGVADRISWAPSGEEFAVGWTPTMTPARIFRVNVEGSAEPMFASEPDDAAFIGKSPELIEFETFDGKMIPAFWFPSEDTEAPVIIDVHGGPEGQRRPGFHPVLQHLAASGFHVLTTNVRGSTGYGKAWSHLDDVELRMDSVRDLAHAHAWIVNHLSGSESRIGIMGQSYGGFMTLSAITEYPDLWFAAVDVVGISNFVTFLERTGPWRRRHREAEYGSLEHNRDFLEAISPIRKVDEIAAPLLVIHGRNDPRVPLHETEQLIASLEQRNHPVESLVFDDEGHGLSKRPNRTTAYAAVADFFWNARNLSDSKP